jgi:hypothetical protein
MEKDFLAAVLKLQRRAFLWILAELLMENLVEPYAVRADVDEVIGESVVVDTTADFGGQQEQWRDGGVSSSAARWC